MTNSDFTNYIKELELKVTQKENELTKIIAQTQETRLGLESDLKLLNQEVTVDTEYIADVSLDLPKVNLTTPSIAHITKALNQIFKLN